MSQHAIEALIPQDFDIWSSVQTIVINGRTLCTARRYGVTFTIVRDEEEWWTVTKIHGGKQVAQFVTKQLPLRVQHVVESAKPRRRMFA